MAIEDPKAFKSSDGNGGHIVTYEDKKRWKETIITGVLVASISGLIVAAGSGVAVWLFNDRKGVISAIANIKSEVLLNRKELTDYTSVAGTLNDMQTDAINRNSAFMAKKWNWSPCIPPIPHMSDLKK